MLAPDTATGIATPPIAAIVHDSPGDTDGLLAAFARRLRADGWRVRGLLQLPRNRAAGDKQMTLVDLNDASRRFCITQDLGVGACGCNLDPGGVAAASVVLRQALAEGADLAIANRFGTLEAGGGGLAGEMLALMAAQVPLLTVVNTRYLAGWRDFTGASAAELAPRAEALAEWFDGLALPRSAP